MYINIVNCYASLPPSPLLPLYVYMQLHIARWSNSEFEVHLMGAVFQHSFNGTCTCTCETVHIEFLYIYIHSLFPPPFLPPPLSLSATLSLPPSL